MPYIEQSGHYKQKIHHLTINNTFDVCREFAKGVKKAIHPDYLHIDITNNPLNTQVKLEASNLYNRQRPLMSTNDDDAVFFSFTIDNNYRIYINHFYTEINGSDLCKDTIYNLFNMLRVHIPNHDKSEIKFYINKWSNQTHLYWKDFYYDTTDFWAEIEDKESNYWAKKKDTFLKLVNIDWRELEDPNSEFWTKIKAGEPTQLIDDHIHLNSTESEDVPVEVSYWENFRDRAREKWQTHQDVVFNNWMAIKELKKVIHWANI